MTSSRRTTYAPDTAAAPAPAPLSLASEQFARLRDLLAAYSGVYLDTARQRVLEQGLSRRLQATGEDLVGYERRIIAPGGRDELRRLAELVLNHETVFFRNAPHVQALRNVVLPELHRRKPHGAPIRIWSAGCATGEEAYSLAIIALETLGRPLSRPVEIWATDLSEPALQKARQGVYRGRALQNVPDDLLRRYFQPSGDGYAVGEAVRTLVRFEALNLLDPFPQEARGIDIIFCQNVTIYFQLDTCRALIARFYESLPEGGLLFLGFSETLWNVFDRFHSREVHGAYVYYKQALEAAPNSDRSPEPRTTIVPVRPQSASRRGRPLTVTTDRPKVFHDRVRRKQTDVEALSRGRMLLEQGEIDRAFETLRHIPPQSDHASQALTLIARAHADRGDLELAAAEVQRAIAIDVLNDEAYLLLGVIYGRQGQWAEAIRQLERARYLSAESPLISFHLAEAYRQGGQPRKAAQEYRNTLRKLDRHPPGAVLDGVAIGWLRESCQRQIEYMPQLI